MITTTLSPDKLLINATVEWLMTQIRHTPTGVTTLDHLLLILPTQQASRRLRLALAQTAGGCIPPKIKLPSELLDLREVNSTPVATQAETLATLTELLTILDLKRFTKLFPHTENSIPNSLSWRLGVARQLYDIWLILGEDALTMTQVAAKFSNDSTIESFYDELAIESDRWQDLAHIEQALFEHLEHLNLIHPSLARQHVVINPELPPDTTAIVLPALTDAQPALYRALTSLQQLHPELKIHTLIHADPSELHRFDSWGRPLPEYWTAEQTPPINLPDSHCILAANSEQQAATAAGLIASIPDDQELPALGLTDPALFITLHSELLSHGKNLHNPAAMPLIHSSLGRTVLQIVQLMADPNYNTCAAWLRSADTHRFLKLNEYHLLKQLDELQQNHLPRTLDDLLLFASQNPRFSTLTQALQQLQQLLAPQDLTFASHLRQIMQQIFAPRPLDENLAPDRELKAAAEALNNLLEALESSVVTNSLASTANQALLFEALVRSAVYSLEPTDPETILTDGWLELPWSPNTELLITGFNEDVVPEAVVGHPFLPDSLRQALGLTHNTQRTARDTFLFTSLLRSRPPNAVTILFERASNRGDVRKPSRLLFLCGNNHQLLAERAQRLYSDSAVPATGHAATLPESWRLKLPLPTETPPLKSLSASKLNSYLRCPFTFYLQYILRMERLSDRSRELDNLQYGNLCHEILETFANSDYRHSADSSVIENFLLKELEQQITKRYTSTPSTVIRLQQDSIACRLSNFATFQAHQTADGWQICQGEVELKANLDSTTILGKIDRIDYHPKHGYRIIDYKTWDSYNSDYHNPCISNKKIVEHMQSLGFPVFDEVDSKGKVTPHVWRDLQLPLYHTLVELNLDKINPTPAIPATPAPPPPSIGCHYLVLGNTSAATAFHGTPPPGEQSSAEQTARHAIKLINAGLFWPHLKLDPDFVHLFPAKIEEGISQEWLNHQEQLLAELSTPETGIQS